MSKFTEALANILVPIITSLEITEGDQLLNDFYAKDPEHAKATIQTLHIGLRELAAIPGEAKIINTLIAGLLTALEMSAATNGIELPA